jgi:hypothetical protein
VTGNQIAFYSTTATVVPVLALGSLLAVTALARTAASRLDDIGASIADGLVKAIEAEFKPLQKKRIGRWLLKVELAGLAWAWHGFGRRLVLPLVLLAFLLPALGEVSALVALAEGVARPGTETAVWIGLGTSAIIALVPIFEVVMFLSTPFAALRSALRVVTSASQVADPTGQNEQGAVSELP